MSGFLLMLVFTAATVQAPPAIEADEEVAFYPTCAALDRDQAKWIIPIRGCIYEPEKYSIKRTLLVKLMEKTLDLDPTEAEKPTLDKRGRALLVDTKDGRKVGIQLGTKVYLSGKSAENGLFETTIELSAGEVRELLQAEPVKDGWLHYRAATGPGDGRVFAGAVQFVWQAGISVVSDIDDTIKVTEVRNRNALLKNTFLRPFEAVPGMPELFSGWAKGGTAFHYVSDSPWQLYGTLEEFMTASGYPKGSFHLKEWRWKDRSFFSLFDSPEKSKPAVIEALLEAYPDRKFIFVGDSGEKDPEIYGALAAKHPRQVIRIYIRNVTQEPAEGERFTKAFQDVPKGNWKVFTKPEELR